MQHDSWQSWESFIPHQAVVVPKPLGQPHNKYRCWHTDSTSHRSRNSCCGWTESGPRVRTWHPSNYMWQMLGACTRTLILCSTEWNLHIWHRAFLPSLCLFLLFSGCYVTRCGPTTNLIKMRWSDWVCCFSVCVRDVFETVLECVENTADVVRIYKTTRQFFLHVCVHVWCVLHVHALIL